MGGSQIFVGVMAIASVAVSVLAIWRVTKAYGVRYKPLWILGCLFGFAGFATNLSTPGDLYFSVGFQIPVFMLSKIGSGDFILKAMFPAVAAVALAKFRSPPSRPSG